MPGTFVGRLERVRQLLDSETGEWAETVYGYDADGNLIAVTDAEGNVTHYVVDDFGQTTRIDSPVTGITDMAYDLGGNLVTRTDGRAVTTISVYDASGRLTGITHDDGVSTEALSFEYDAAGRRTRAASSEVVQTFASSRRGLILTARQEVGGTTHDTRYSYTLDGQLEAITYPSGRQVVFDTDHAGRPTAITSTAPGGGAIAVVAETLEYLPFGPAARLELGPPAGRLVEDRTHDWQYRRTAQTLSGPGAAGLLDLEYGYDASGNLLSRTDHLGDRSAGYGYDDLSRLTSAAWTGASRDYEYDAIGNIERIGVDEGLPGEGEVRFGYAANPFGNNSPVLAGTETYQAGVLAIQHDVLSDEVGNVTSDGLTSLSYDARNHLEDRGLKGATLDYTYSADGRLVRSVRSDTQSVTDIVLDIAGRRLAKLEDGTWRDYVYLGDQLLAYFDGNAAEPTQVIADHIGMPMMAADGTGAVVWEAQAEPYGELRGQVGLSADPGLRYPGQWQDELDLEATCAGDTCTMPGPLEDSYSLFENGYRWYRPVWGRYGQADPIGSVKGSAMNLATNHLYGYVDGNPVRYTDPFGLVKWDCGFVFGSASSFVGLGAGYLHAVCTSECTGGKQVFVQLSTASVGISAGLLPIGVTGFNAFLDDGSKTLDAQNLVGPVWYGSAGLWVGPGFGCSNVHLGQAKGEFGCSFTWFGGLDSGLDVYFGYSAIVDGPEESCCE